MKRFIILSVAMALLASCNQGSGDVASYKKQVDSLKSELALRPAMPGTVNKMNTGAAFAVDSSGITTIPPNYMDSLIYDHALDTTTANRWIQDYHSLVVDSMPQYRKSMTFLIDAKILRSFVLADTSITYLTVYIAKKSANSLTLVYVGAKPDTNNKGKLTEQPFKFTGGRNANVLEEVYPCPECDKISIHPGAPSKS